MVCHWGGYSWNAASKDGQKDMSVQVLCQAASHSAETAGSFKFNA